MATIEELMQRAEAGDATAQFTLGYMYKKGRGVTQNYTKAVMWYRRAAEQGHVGAQNNLGHMYEKGYGVSWDYAEAAKWYSKAAEQGDALAQCNLGLLYERGYGVHLSLTIASKWYEKSAAQGNELAKKRLEKINNNVIITPPPKPSFPPEFTVEDGVLVAYTGVGGSVKIPEGVTAIGDKAFTSDIRIETVDIPSSVTVIEETAFADLPYLSAIRVDSKNPVYCSRDEALYTKDLSVLLQYPVANRNTYYTAPDELLRVGMGAFYRCRELHYVTLPEVIEIGAYAFFGCIHLHSLTAMADEIDVGADAFCECSALSIVNAPALMARRAELFPDSHI